VYRGICVYHIYQVYQNVTGGTSVPWWFEFTTYTGCTTMIQAVLGCALVVLGVYRERSLQTATNYFIVSLAIADIMVAILVMPLAVYVEVRLS